MLFIAVIHLSFVLVQNNVMICKTIFHFQFVQHEYQTARVKGPTCFPSSGIQEMMRPLNSSLSLEFVIFHFLQFSDLAIGLVTERVSGLHKPVPLIPEGFSFRTSVGRELT